MIKSALIPTIAVALLVSASLSAQEAKVKRADTLRRELTVMTEEEVTLSTRQPRDLTYTVSEPVLPPVRHRRSPTSVAMPSSRLVYPLA